MLTLRQLKQLQQRQQQQQSATTAYKFTLILTTGMAYSKKGLHGQAL
jgi:hypothetical protein